MTVYQVYHYYTETNEFGAVEYDDVVMTFQSAHDAETFVEEFNDDHANDDKLYVKSVEIIPTQENDEWVKQFDACELWWLDNEIRFRNTLPKIFVKPENILSNVSFKDGCGVMVAADFKNGVDIYIEAEDKDNPGIRTVYVSCNDYNDHFSVSAGIEDLENVIRAFIKAYMEE